MCKVYNTVGSLKTIKTRLAQHKIDFTSLDELIAFQNNYATAREQIISTQRTLLTEERNNLSSAIIELENEIAKKKIEIKQRLQSEIETLQQQFDALAGAEKSFIQEFTYSFKALFIEIKIKYRELFSGLIISSFIKRNVTLLAEKRKRSQYLVSNFEGAVSENSKLILQELDQKKRAIDEINTSIYGAIGEQKVVTALEQLPDEYILINDFSLSFNKPIYNRRKRDSIKSIQIDHLLISPAGIFLIETKNWSKQSLQNLNLRSPVEQINRASFALFKIVHDNSNINLGEHHWGERKVPIRNLIVLIHHKPTEEFQYVKILTLHELLGYIEYFKPSLTNEETQGIANYLINYRQ